MPFLTIYSKQKCSFQKTNKQAKNILAGFDTIALITLATYRGYNEAKQYLTILLIKNIFSCLKEEERNKHL